MVADLISGFSVAPCSGQAFPHAADCLCLDEFLHVGDGFGGSSLHCHIRRNDFPFVWTGLIPLLAVLSGDVGHCFPFLLMAVVLFSIREKQLRTFTVAADSPQIRLHMPKREIAGFNAETLHEPAVEVLTTVHRGSGALANAILRHTLPPHECKTTRQYRHPISA